MQRSFLPVPPSIEPTPAEQPHFIRALLPNQLGHDYLVGDIHGHFSRMRDALEARGFRPECDRLISVGDLVDRGPENAEAADWLEQPWFHAIRGNHEDLYLGWRALRGSPADQRQYELDGYRKNGGTWMAEVSEAAHQRLEAHIQALPYVLILPANGRTLAVVHAELPDEFRWPSSLNEEFRPDWVEKMTWGREAWLAWRHQANNPAHPEPWLEGLDALVVGHTRVPSPQVWGNMVFLDTGGWRKEGVFSVVRSDEVLSWVDGDTEPPTGRP